MKTSRFNDIILTLPWHIVKPGFHCSSGAQCFLCKKTFSITNSGVSQVISHSTGVKHKSLLRSKTQTRGSHFLVGSSFVRC